MCRSKYVPVRARICVKGTGKQVKWENALGWKNLTGFSLTLMLFIKELTLHFCALEVKPSDLSNFVPRKLFPMILPIYNAQNFQPNRTEGISQYFYFW